MPKTTGGGGSPRIEVEPERALADEPIAIGLKGCDAGEHVTLRAKAVDDSGREWVSQAVFHADASGEVDVEEASPISGTYRGADAMGPLWSMRPVKKERAASGFKVEKPDVRVVTISVEAGGKSASRDIERIYMAEGVKRLPVEEEGLAGTLFIPGEGGSHPGVIILHGTDGNLREDVASVLASRGFAALALLYFGAKGLPDEFIRIPLEYFEKAIAWLQAREEVRAGGVGLIGRSRGGELALLAASIFEQVKAVVSVCGGGVIFEGLHKNPRAGGVESPFSYRGEPVPYLKRVDSGGFTARAIWSGMTGKPLSTLSTYVAALDDEGALREATIEVERIKGAVLLVSGNRDAVWPSARLSRIAMKRLADHDHLYPFEHLNYDKAGHGIGMPDRPTTVNQTVTFSGMTLGFGGDPRENAHAAADSWPRTVEFLRGNLGA